MNKGRTEQIIKLLEGGEKTLQEMSDLTGLSRDNIYQTLRHKLIDTGKAIRSGQKFNEVSGRMNDVYKLAMENEQEQQRGKVLNGIPVIVHLSKEDYDYLINRSKATKSLNIRKIIEDSRSYTKRISI